MVVGKLKSKLEGKVLLPIVLFTVFIDLIGVGILLPIVPNCWLIRTLVSICYWLDLQARPRFTWFLDCYFPLHAVFGNARFWVTI